MEGQVEEIKIYDGGVENGVLDILPGTIHI
jgi:hypothetical protein